MSEQVLNGDGLSSGGGDRLSPKEKTSDAKTATDFLVELRRANSVRNAEYRAKTDGSPLPLLFRTTELAGEIGELLNVVKKIERERLGWGGKKATREDLVEEVGGVMACLDLLCMDLGIDIASATAAEFNKVSDRLSLQTRIEDR